MRKTIVLALLAVGALFICGSVPQGGLSGASGVTTYTPLFILPDTIFASASQECNIYSDQVAPTMPWLTPWFLRASSDSAGGSKLTSRGWRWTPAAAASKMLRFHALDPDGNTLAADSVMVRAVANTNGWGEQRHMFVGDSVMNDTINTRGIVREVLRLANTVYAHGDSLMTIGPSGFAGFNQVTHSGIRWRDYALGNHANFNPFKINSKLDFKTWMTTNRSQPTFNTLAHSWWLLGYNDLANWSLGHERVTTADLAGIAVHIDSLFTAMLDADTGYPSSKITICTLPMPADDLSANGASYRAMRFYGSMYAQNIRDYNRYIISRYDAGAWNARVDVCDVAAWVDRKYGYPHTYADPAARAAEDVDHVPIYSNYIHPDSTGHYQIADAIFGHLNGKRAEETQRNRLAESENVSGIWTLSGISTDSTMTAPDGMTDAERFVSPGDAISYMYTGVTMSSASCISFYMHLGPGDATQLFRVVFNGGGGTSLTVDFNVSSGPTATLITTPASTFAFGSSSASGGWLRIYVTDLIAADSGKTMNCSIYNDRAGNIVRRTGIWGIQFEHAAAPTAYQSRP